jgi:hypothetical protein
MGHKAKPAGHREEIGGTYPKLIQWCAGEGPRRVRAEPISGIAHLSADEEETMELIIDAEVPTPDRARC